MEHFDELWDDIKFCLLYLSSRQYRNFLTLSTEWFLIKFFYSMALIKEHTLQQGLALTSPIIVIMDTLHIQIMLYYLTTKG